MSELWKYLQKLPPSMSLIVLLFAVILVFISKWETIVKISKSMSGKVPISKRTCGDCILILFGIREKYEYSRRQIDTDLLRHQMKFAEQKIQEAIFFLAQSFNDDIRVSGNEASSSRKVTESALYCEALKNGMLSLKDELRRSFKENGFASFSEGEYTQYVKDKTKILLTTVRSYLNQHYVETDETVIKLRDRFEKMDKFHISKFEGWVFEVFSNAKDLGEETIKNKRNLENKFRADIDKFVNEGRPSNTAC